MICFNVFEAICGCVFWKIYSKLFEVDKYIFFPSNEIEYNEWGIVMLPAYVHKLESKSILVIVSEKRLKKIIENNFSDLVKVKKISILHMRWLMKYYALVNQKWVVVSVKQPYCTGADKLLGIRNISYKDIVYYDVFGFTHEIVEDAIDFQTIERIRIELRNEETYRCDDYKEKDYERDTT